jgi:hypothetical protein
MTVNGAAPLIQHPRYLLTGTQERHLAHRAGLEKEAPVEFRVLYRIR